MAASPDDLQATRQRLLEAAGEVFAKSGFREATIGAICKKAQANIAAVNYHFGSKEALYQEVLLYARTCSMQFGALQKIPDNQPVEQLRAYIHQVLHCLATPDKPSWFVQLMAREMSEPTDALDALVRQDIGPNFEWLGHVIERIVGYELPLLLRRRIIFSIVGQCVYYHLARPMVERLAGSDYFADAPGLERHVMDFSLAAIYGLAGKGEKP